MKVTLSWTQMNKKTESQVLSPHLTYNKLSYTTTTQTSYHQLIRTTTFFTQNWKCCQLYSTLMKNTYFKYHQKPSHWKSIADSLKSEKPTVSFTSSNLPTPTTKPMNLYSTIFNFKNLLIPISMSITKR